MPLNRTFTIIKPDATAKGHIGSILAMITSAGFEIVALKMTRLEEERAKAFYKVHEDKPFYSELVKFMSSGKLVAAILQKENAVEDFRTLIGSTNPDLAAEGTIRKRFAESMSFNAVHGSDSDDNALLESDFFFSDREIFLD